MSNVPWPDAVVLENAHARLEPLRPEHADALAEASADGELWRLWYTQVAKPEGMPAEIARRLDLREKGSMLPFAVFRTGEDRPVGMTSYMNIDARNRRVEIGSTWYARSVQRTPLNTACKLLLLTHAFETLDCIAVEWRTHFMNQQSRRAIERLGAKLDGVLRNHAIAADGSLRDTCVYSVIASEWPAVRSHLHWQFDKPRA